MEGVDQILQREIDDRKSPSVQYYFFDKENIVKHFCAGLANIRDNQPASISTSYHAFSVTKTFTALAVLQLTEKGWINLDDLISLHLCDFPNGNKITIRQVLTHSAGLPNPMPLNWIHLVEEDKHFDRNSFFDEVFAKHKNLKSAPNEKFAYSNLGYVLLGRLIERISGTTYESYIEENILARLNLNKNELGFEIAGMENFATGYQKSLTLINFLLGMFLNKSKFMDSAVNGWKPFKPFYINGTSYGGLIGAAGSFVKYIQELLNPNSKLISAEYKAMLFQENRNSRGENTGMCLSWFTGQLNGEQYFCHAGGGGGYYCEIRIYPGIKMGSVIFFNRTGMRDERFLDKVDNLALQSFHR